jgi:hypothetical protein
MILPFAPVDPVTLQKRLESIFDQVLPLMEKSSGEHRAMYCGQLQGLLAALFQAGIIAPEDYELRRLAVQANYDADSVETYNPINPHS